MHGWNNETIFMDVYIYIYIYFKDYNYVPKHFYREGFDDRCVTINSKNLRLSFHVSL